MSLRDPLVDALMPTDADVHERERWSSGTVSSLSPLEVTIDGVAGIPASRLAQYTATMGDVVWCQLRGRGAVIHGRITTP